MIYESENLNALSRILEAIEDQRGMQGRKHRMIDILILTIYGSLFGYTDFVNMVDDLKYKEAYFTKLLGLENGIPSHDTFSAVFSVINPQEFLECFMSWMTWITSTKNGHIALDGKAIRAACDKVHKGKIPYIVNAYMVSAGLCIGQIRIDDKTNEIKGIPEMIKWLDLEGATVTIDAIGCQKEIVNMLIEKGADYVLPVKDNQPTLHSDILFELETIALEKEAEDIRIKKSEKNRYKIDTPINDSYSSYSQTNNGHGRIERRRHLVWNNPQCIDKKEWTQVESIGMVIRDRVIIHKDENEEIIEETGSSEVCCYIMSRKMEATEFAYYVRNHWGVESLHWVLDDCFREDRCTSRHGNATENLALMRKTIFNLMKMDENVKGKSMKGKQVYYQNNLDAIGEFIFEELPSRYNEKNV